MAEAARQLHPLPQADAAWMDWVPVAEAARALGVHRDSLSRRCREELEPRGLARQARPPGGGNRTWMVDRELDPARLGRGGLLEVETPPDLSGYTLRQVALAQARKRCVEAYRDAKRTRAGGVNEWIGRLVDQLRRGVAADLKRTHGWRLKVSRRSLQRWDREYQGPADFEALIDRRGGDHRSGGEPAAWSFFKQLYLNENRMKVKVAWRMTGDEAGRRGWAWCSYDACRRQLDERIPPAVQTERRNPRAFRNSVETTAQMDPETWAANECWIGDHAELDVMVRVPGRERPARPWITAWMDWRTRKIVGHVITLSPDSTTIGAALKRGIEDRANLGPPALVWIDNGKDYKARVIGGMTKGERLKLRRGYLDEPVVGGILGMLSIEAHFSIPHNPRGKGRLETWFGHWLHERFDKTFLTAYTGNAPHNRPEHLNQTARKPGALPTLSEVEAAVGRFIEGYNRGVEHDKADLCDERGVKLSPADALDAWGTKRVLSEPGVLKYLLLHRSRPLSVGKNGVRMNVKGRTLGWGAGEPALIPYQRAPGRPSPPKVVLAVDPHDLGEAWVFEVSGRVICPVALNNTGGRYGTAITMDQVRDVQSRRKRHKRAMRLIAEEDAPLRLPSPEEQAADQAARDRRADRGGERPQPAAYQAVQTPIDGELKELQRNELKQAAGGETGGSGGGGGRRGIPPLSQLRRYMPDARAASAAAEDRPLPSPRDMRASTGKEGEDGDQPADPGPVSPWSAYREGRL